MSDMGGVFGFFLGLSLLKIFTAIWDYLLKTPVVKWIRAWPIWNKIGFKSIQDIFKLYRRWSSWSLFWSLKMVGFEIDYFFLKFEKQRKNIILNDILKSDVPYKKSQSTQSLHSTPRPRDRDRPRLSITTCDVTYKKQKLTIR